MANVEIKVISYEEARLSYFKELQERQKKRFEQFEKSSAIKELPPQEKHLQLSQMGEVLQYYDDIIKMFEADVVPKSECDKWYYEYHAIKDELKQEKMYHKETEKLVDKYCVELQTAKSEVEKLVQDGTRLVQEKDALIKNYAECMKDYAREIFEEIEKIILDNTYPDFNREHKPVNIWKAKTGYDAFDELKKKYTEGEPIPATEEKHFSPEDVKNMTPQEVREKYIAIRRSMERW